MPDSILFVDDEPLLLDSTKRELGFQYEILTATSGAEGLEKLHSYGPVAVAVADYRMPQMDGVKFLTRVREAFPDVVRMMLTGNADLQTAIQAVNEGQVFRFLLKPCSQENMAIALQDALRQYHLVISERELLENTLLESVNVLTDILSFVNPQAYGKSLRVRQWVVHVARALQLEQAWEYELAAALSNLGWIIFPQPLLEKLSRGQSLNAEDLVTFSKHPSVTRNLIGRIPRLGRVAKIISGQDRSLDDLCMDAAKGDTYIADFGSHILNVCSDFDQYLQQGMLPQEAISMMRAQRGKYVGSVLDALSELKIGEIRDRETSPSVEEVGIDTLESGMVLTANIKDSFGNILYKSGTTIDRAIIIDLFKLSIRPGLVIEPFMIIRPHRNGGDA